MTTVQCTVEDCHTAVVARGLCVKHYKRWRRYGDPLVSKRIQKYPEGASCSVDGCERPVKGHGLCRMHLDRQRDYGEIGPVGTLGASRRKRGLSPGRTLNSLGYVIIWQSDLKKYLFEHRLVMEQMIGRPLEDYETVHHKNGRRDDNSPDNLELWVVPPRKGQRVEDLVIWVVEHYQDYVMAALEGRPHLFAIEEE